MIRCPIINVYEYYEVQDSVAESTEKQKRELGMHQEGEALKFLLQKGNSTSQRLLP